MTFHVERIDHVVIRVRDLGAMVRFYEQALGFKVERTLDRLNLVQMRAGASMLDLVRGERPDAGGNMDHLCFRIEPFDREAILKRLSPLGIALGDSVQRYGAEGTGPSVYFNDPEGNQIELKGPSTSPVPPA
jgi:glyoxylase I family protein